MRGLMMEQPLLLKSLLWRAERVFGDQEIVSVTEAGTHRYTFADHVRRVRQLANVLADLGVERGDRVGTLAWNDHRHYEIYFAAPCSGAVLHTINLRLFPEQIAYIINHAEDRVLFVAPDLLPLVGEIRDTIPKVATIVVLADAVPETTVPGVLAYEALMDGASAEYEFPELDENTASSMCYTSATTGDPKGVVYSHRSTFLHSMALGLHDSMALRESMVALPVAPMFHVNSWGIPFGAAMHGTKLVLPGPRPTPSVYAELIEQEKVSLLCAAVTVGIQFREFVETSPRTYDLSSLTTVLLGGQAPPRGLMEWFDRTLGAYVVQGWGATETNPIVTWDFLKQKIRDGDRERYWRTRTKQGVPYPGIEVGLVDDDGAPLPWDGETMGNLLLRGPWVARSYYEDPERSLAAFTADGWFRTGDVGVIDADGYVALMDRSLDMVKSGGEWISSVTLENALMAHKGVVEAAVVAIPDERWVERPLALVVARNPAAPPSVEELKAFLGERVAGWWIPDDVLFLEEIPKTGVGEFNKRALRAMAEELLMRDRDAGTT